MQTPALQAQLDWITTGEFNPDQFTGDDRKAYNEAASAILRQWDNQEVRGEYERDLQSYVGNHGRYGCHR